MQLYKNNRQVKVIYGSRSHHFNKRRLAKARQRYELSMQQMLDTDKIDTYMMKHHIKVQDYAGGYTDIVSKHRLQAIFSKPANNKRNQAKSDAIEKDLDSAIDKDDWIDMLDYWIRGLARFPKCTSVHQFLKTLEDGCDTQTITHDKHGKPLKFWKFIKKPFKPLSAKWFSQRFSRRPAWTGDNLAYCIKHNSFDRIKEQEHWLPNPNDSNTFFVFWGDFGAHQDKAMQYLKHNYSCRGFCDMYTRPFNGHSPVKYFVTTDVLPIRLIRRNQRSAFKYLLKHGERNAMPKDTYDNVKRMIRSNYRQHQWLFDNQQDHPIHTLTMDGGNIQQLYHQIDELMQCHHRIG